MVIRLSFESVSVLFGFKGELSTDSILDVEDSWINRSWSKGACHGGMLSACLESEARTRRREGPIHSAQMEFLENNNSTRHVTAI